MSINKSQSSPIKHVSRKRKSLHVPGLTLSFPAFPHLDHYINTDQDEKKVIVTSSKALVHVSQHYTSDPLANKLFRSVYRPGMRYRFKTTKVSTLSSTAGGVLQVASPVYPSSMSEYTPLSGIFDECRLMSTRVKVAMFSNGTSPSPCPIAISFDPSNVSSAPSFGVAAVIPGVKMYNIFQTAGELHNEWRSRTPRPWSLISASGTGSDPVGGVIGTWYFSLSSITTASVPILTYLIECDYEFRNPT